MVQWKILEDRPLKELDENLGVSESRITQRYYEAIHALRKFADVDDLIDDSLVDVQGKGFTKKSTEPPPKSLTVGGSGGLTF